MSEEKRKTMLMGIKSLFIAIKEADKIDSFKFKSFFEKEEYPQFCAPSIQVPTGWVNIEISIRLHRKIK